MDWLVAPLRALASVRLRTVALIRRDPVFAAAFTALSLVALWPLWCARFLPLLDLPTHLSAIAIFHRYADPSWGYSHFYTLSPLPAPYWGYYYPVHLLAFVLPIELANKLYLSCFAVALPASVALFARHFGRSHWVCVLAFPAIYSFSFGWGFISYCAGVPALLFALVALDRFVARPSVPGWLGLFALGALTYFMHLVPWVLFGLCSLLLLLARLRRPGRVALAGMALLPTVGLFFWNLRLATREATRAIVQAGPLDYKGGYETAAEALCNLQDRLFLGPLDVMRGFDRQLAVLLALNFLLLASAARPSQKPATTERASFLPELFFLVSVAGYVLLPLRVVKPIAWWNVNPRLVLPAMVFGATLLRGPIEGARRLLLVPAALGFVCYAVSLGATFRTFDKPARAFASLMEKVPRGSSTLFLSVEGNPLPSLTSGLPYYEFGSYAQLLAGGYNPFDFGAGFPYRTRSGAQLAAPGWSTKWGHYSQSAHGSHYDYLVTYKEESDGQVLREAAKSVPLTGHIGDFRLYATKGIE